MQTTPRCEDMGSSVRGSSWAVCPSHIVAHWHKWAKLLLAKGSCSGNTATLCFPVVPLSSEVNLPAYGNSPQLTRREALPDTLTQPLSGAGEPFRASLPGGPPASMCPLREGRSFLPSPNILFYTYYTASVLDSGTEESARVPTS